MDLLIRLQEEFPDTVVIMVTAYASIEAAVSATKRGAFDFIAKPFTPKELRETVNKAVRHLVLKRPRPKIDAREAEGAFRSDIRGIARIESPTQCAGGYSISAQRAGAAGCQYLRA